MGGHVWAPHSTDLTSVRARLSLLALLAIAVPAGIVAVLGYVSLRHWQASAELLFREQARDMAAMAVDKIEMTLRETENGLVAALQGALEAPAPLAGSLGAFLAAHPLVRRLYVFDRRGELLYPATRDESDAVIFARLLAEVSQGFWERGGRRELTGGDQIALAAILRGPDGRPALATLTWNVEVLCEAILARTVRTLEAPTILAVLDERDRPIFSKESLTGADRLLTVPFRERLATWRLAVYQPPGDSPRQAVRRQVMLFMCAFGVLLVVMAAGTVMTWRLTRREAEMAQLKSDFVANVSHDLNLSHHAHGRYPRPETAAKVRDGSRPARLHPDRARPGLPLCLTVRRHPAGRPRRAMPPRPLCLTVRCRGDRFTPTARDQPDRLARPCDAVDRGVPRVPRGATSAEGLGGPFRGPPLTIGEPPC